MPDILKQSFHCWQRTELIFVGNQPPAPKTTTQTKANSIDNQQCTDTDTLTMNSSGEPNTATGAGVARSIL